MLLMKPLILFRIKIYFYRYHNNKLLNRRICKFIKSVQKLHLLSAVKINKFEFEIWNLFFTVQYLKHLPLSSPRTNRTNPVQQLSGAYFNYILTYLNLYIDMFNFDENKVIEYKYHQYIQKNHSQLIFLTTYLLSFFFNTGAND